MKKLRSKGKLAVAASLALILSIPTLAHAEQQQGSSPASLVPVKTVADSLGAKVEWDGAKKQVTVTRGTATVVLTVGKNTALVNGESASTGEAVAIVKDRSYVGLHFINSALGTRAGWNEADQSVVFDQGDYIGRAGQFVHELFGGDSTKVSSQLSPALKLALPDMVIPIIAKQFPMIYGQPYKQLSASLQQNDVHTTAAFLYETGGAPLEISVRFNGQGLVDDMYLAPVGPTEAYKKPAYDKENYSEKEVVIGEGTFALPGTLTLPKGEGPFPAVVLVQGSGPHDRDSSIGGSKAFRDLAVGLAAQNIAVLRYEKVTKEHTFKVSANPYFTLKNESVDDALKAVALLKGVKEVDADRIFVAGHSQGGYVVPIILENDKDHQIAGSILLSAPSTNMTDAIIEQQKEALDRLHKLGAPDELIQAQEQAAAALTGLANLVQDPAYSKDNMPADFPMPPAYWWYEQRDYVPVELIKQQEGPFLITQGENDWQVSMKQFEGWKNALSGRDDVTFVSYPKMNHVLSEYDGISIGMEYAGASNVAEKLVNDVASWINKQ